MATVYIPYPGIDKEGIAREGEPMPRPFVKLKDGTVMSYKEWSDKKQPA